MLKRDSPGRLVKPEYCDMRRRVLGRIASGRLTEGSDLSKFLDSLELLELTMEVEESGIEPAVEIKTVRDFLWLCKAMDLQRQRERD
jgi:hypothetical protein